MPNFSEQMINNHSVYLCSYLQCSVVGRICNATYYIKKECHIKSSQYNMRAKIKILYFCGLNETGRTFRQGEVFLAMIKMVKGSSQVYVIFHIVLT